MFEELGYKQEKHNIFDELPKRDEWITQDSPYIMYSSEDVIGGTTYAMFIEFMVRDKRVQLGGWEKGQRANQPYQCFRNPILNIKEVQAIVQQCKELGWLDDENN